MIGTVMQDGHDKLSGSEAAALVERLREQGRQLGFAALAIAGVDLSDAEPGLLAWLAAGFHGGMDYMARHGLKRARPAELVPGTLSVVSVRMDYLTRAPVETADASQAAIARYAHGRDYHKLMRARLQRLAHWLQAEVAGCGARVFVDSAPVLEVELAARAGLGWRGKHTLLLNRDAGSFFFLGEIYLDLALPVDPPQTAHCGDCRRCLDVCPTAAIVAPYRLDARRCISYLTIEHEGPIPEALRPLLGNRVYGCDDCQLVCPWNRFARVTEEPDFAVRNGLDAALMVSLFAWSESEFMARMAGSAIYRIGYERWLRNLAVGLGNAPTTPALVEALRARSDHASALVREHVQWALARHGC
ncbi:MAG: hypothetical protein RJA63_3473 [Pseudomonadota bacterium]|jgi:epoxyqueuosine reductase